MIVVREYISTWLKDKVIECVPPRTSRRIYKTEYPSASIPSDIILISMNHFMLQQMPTIMSSMSSLPDH